MDEKYFTLDSLDVEGEVGLKNVDDLHHKVHPLCKTLEQLGIYSLNESYFRRLQHVPPVFQLFFFL